MVPPLLPKPISEEEVEKRDPPRPFLEHLQEMRVRLLRSLAVFFVAFLLCYPFAKEIFAFLLSPLKEALPPKGNLVFTRLTEPFMVYLKTSLLAGLFLSSPYLFWEIFLFLRPAFRGEEERYFLLYIFFSSFLFLIGGLFGYFVVFPIGFSALLKVAGSDFFPMLSIEEYFSLSVKLLLAFGIIFQTPVVFYILGRLRLVSYETLKKGRRFAIVIIFIVAAILTPPDVFSQILMAIPLLLLYEISLFLVKFSERKGNR